MLKRNKKRADSVVESAERQVGYRAQPERRSAFNTRKEYHGQPWGGMFVQRILTDAYGAEPEVSFASTVTALGYYAQRNRLYARKVRRGDIVFFNFATDPRHPFEQPHIGVVVEVRDDGSFRTVEGETSPGVPQGSQLVDGVFYRERYRTDILAVVRPKPRPVPRTVKPVDGERATVKMSYFESNPKTVRRVVETVQLALNRARPAFTFNRGRKDGTFRSALGVYARETGTVQNRGEIDYNVLDRLGEETGTFTVE